MKELKDVAGDNLPASEKQKKAGLLQARIQLVQQQIAALQQQQQDQAARRSADAAGADGTPRDGARPQGPASRFTQGAYLDLHA